jgi:hypothetical protein
MTLPRYRALHRHWRRHPRPEWLIAGYLGFRPPPEDAPMIVRPGDLRPQGGPGASAGIAARGGRVPPPTGALQTMFSGLGGQPGKTVVVA